jgi:hypothetical protein
MLAPTGGLASFRSCESGNKVDESLCLRREMFTGRIQSKKREALIGPIRKQVDQATFGERPLDAELHQLGYSIAREANSVAVPTSLTISCAPVVIFTCCERRWNSHAKGRRQQARNQGRRTIICRGSLCLNCLANRPLKDWTQQVEGTRTELPRQHLSLIVVAHLAAPRRTHPAVVEDDDVGSHSRKQAPTVLYPEEVRGL